MSPAVLGALLAALVAAGEAGADERAAAPPVDRYPRAAASYLVEVDGRPLWARAPDAPRAPASLTKLMTALVVLEAKLDPDGWVEVSPAAARATGSRLGLRSGEALRVRDALLATLVGSANDACLALAERVGGDVGGFVARMNARAAALRLRATRFADPCGHDAPGHRSSASDLARLARAVLAEPRLRGLVAVERAVVTTRAGRDLEVRTGNMLLGRVEGARGLKSGYTSKAGRCLAALVERDGVEVLLVLLDAKDRWWTAAGLVEAAFDEARRGR